MLCEMKSEACSGGRERGEYTESLGNDSGSGLYLSTALDYGKKWSLFSAFFKVPKILESDIGHCDTMLEAIDIDTGINREEDIKL